MNPEKKTEIHNKVQLIKKAAEELSQLGEDFPAIQKNTLRILASTKMLELNISDVVDLETLPREE